MTRQCKWGEVYARGVGWVQAELTVWATVSVFALDAENFNVEAKTNAEKKQLGHITDDTLQLCDWTLWGIREQSRNWAK